MGVGGECVPSAVDAHASGLAVLVRSNGLQVAGRWPEPALPLELTDLEALERYASKVAGKGAAKEPASVTGGAAILELLAQRGQLPVSNGSFDADAASEAIGPAPTAATDVASVLPAGPLVLEQPLVFGLGPGGFDLVDHDGRLRARLSALELFAAAEFRQPIEPRDAWTNLTTSMGTSAPTEAQLTALAARLVGAGVLAASAGNAASADHGTRIFAAEHRKHQDFVAKVSASIDEWESSRATTGSASTRVVPVSANGRHPSLSVGMLFAYAQGFDGGRLKERYDFRPDWNVDLSAPGWPEDEPAVFLVSNYQWNHEAGLLASANAKAHNAGSVVIHGGPNTPKYEADAEVYLRTHHQVDVLVHGEGEATTAEILDALSGSVADGATDLGPLHDVAGVTFRLGDRIVHTGPRDRIEDLDTIPSPYLTGVFSDYEGMSDLAVIIETNRGCPYGCTFCDWGSATMSRIRKFDLERVFAELEWAARNEVGSVLLADANFGIWSRDVEIAEKVASLKEQYGYPYQFWTCFAKNTSKHLKKIITAMVDAEIWTEATISLQSMDSNTLETIQRSNIRVDKYEELASAFREAKLPLFVELMMGLPGSTRESFANDLQQCIDRELPAKVYPTMMLPNSPMNAPAYREENDIRTDGAALTSRSLVVSTSTYSADDLEEMKWDRRVFVLFDNFGVLRQVSRFVRQEAGIREIDFYRLVTDAARANREAWPTIALTIEMVPELCVPPVSWRSFISEVHRFVVDVVGLADDDALATVLDVQHAVLPALGREFPRALSLPHDYAAWHAAVLEAKSAARLHASDADVSIADWTDDVARLSTFPPATFEVGDPDEVCSLCLGNTMEAFGVRDGWELESPVARAARFVPPADR